MYSAAKLILLLRIFADNTAKVAMTVTMFGGKINIHYLLKDKGSLLPLSFSLERNMREKIIIEPAHNKLNDLLIILDAQDEAKMNLVRGNIPFLAFGVFDPLVVGIKTNPLKRGYDFLPECKENETILKRGANLGGADALLNYIKDDLLPSLENEFGSFRTRAIIGWSLGGSFVNYLFLKDNDLLDAYIAISPNFEYDKFQFVELYNNFNFSDILNNKFLYMCIADEGEAISQEWKIGFDKITKKIKTSKTDKLHFTIEDFSKNENHISIYPLGLRNALFQYFNFMLEAEIFIKSYKKYIEKYGINQGKSLIKKTLGILESQRMASLHEKITLLQQEVTYPCD